MTAYTFTKVTPVTKLNIGVPTTVVATFDVDVETSSAGLANGDTISGIPVPSGATIVDWTLTIPELDSAGSPTGTFDLGDASDVDRFLDGVAMGGSATHYVYTPANAPLPAALVSSGDTENTPANGVGYTYTSASSIILTVASALATAVTSGVVTLSVTYTDNAY